MKQKHWIFGIFLMGLWGLMTMGDLRAQGISYQAIARNNSGTVLAGQNISVQFSIYTGAPSGTPLWQETHNVTTNNFGLYSLVIGNGVSTGAGSLTAFSSIPWKNMDQQLVISVDPAGGSSFAVVDTVAFHAVPYAYHAITADSSLHSPNVHELTEVDTAGIVNGQLLKWNGTNWIPANDNDSDTVSYAYYAGHALTSDTSNTAYNLVNYPDTVQFAYQSDTAAFAIYADTAYAANHASYSDTAQFAWNTVAVNAWNLNGNAGTNSATQFIGTTDSTDFVLRTNNTERMRIMSDGRIGIGTSFPKGAFHIESGNIFLSTGTFGSGPALSVTGAGTRMFWYPKRSAFRVGTVTGTQFDDLNIGEYSFACGYNSVARGQYSFAAGESSSAYATHSVALGYGNIASGIVSFSAGSVNNATGAYAIALGRGNIASDSSSVAIGYHSNAMGKYAIAFGFQNTASGPYSITMGYHANTSGRTGSIIFSDASSSAYTTSSADNQFVARASGGFFLYSNSALTAGVTLAPGSGSWSSVSDRRRKENFRQIDEEQLMESLRKIKVCSWNYKSQDASIRHIGPMAQDFKSAFGYGESDTTITVVDIDGVNMAALKALELKTRELEQKTAEMKEMEKTLIELKEREKLLREKLDHIERMLLSAKEN